MVNQSHYLTVTTKNRGGKKNDIHHPELGRGNRYQPNEPSWVGKKQSVSTQHQVLFVGCLKSK